MAWKSASATLSARRKLALHCERLRSARRSPVRRDAAAHLAGLLFAFASLLFPDVCAAQADFLNLINAYRADRQKCAGRMTGGVPPLKENPALASVAASVVAGSAVDKVLKRAGYSAEKVHWIEISGSADPAQIVKLLAQHYCAQLVSKEYSEIGVSQDGKRWSIVLAAPRAGPVDARAAAARIVTLTNEARAKARRCGNKAFAKAPPVKWNDTLADAATRHSEDMASRNYFSHIAKDGSDPTERVVRAGYRYRVVAENIAAGQSEPREVIAGWLASPGHCANLMNPKVTEIGVGTHTDRESDFVVYWTQIFAVPR